MENKLNLTDDEKIEKEEDASEEELADLAKDILGELGSGTYTHIFKKPFQWEGKTYGQLTFDFESLTGRDSLKISRELAAKSIKNSVPYFEAEFQIRVAARACTEKIGIDALENMSMIDFEQIMNRVRNFFVNAVFSSTKAGRGSEDKS